MTTIPFCSRSSMADQHAWIAALDAALSGSGITITPFATMAPAERAAARVAIVANPDPAELAAMPRLEWVQSLWAGVERMLAELGENGPAIVRMEDPQLAETMAEAVLAWTLYLHRDMPLYARQQRARMWAPQPLPLSGERVVGILGFGNLGRRAGERLQANGFDVRGWNRSGRDHPSIPVEAGRDGLERLVSAADILVLLLPQTPDTIGLFDTALLARAKPGARLINFARGPIIAEAALLAALDSGALDHAVLDVFDREPLPPEHSYWTHPAVTVLPHISAPTTKHTAAAIVARNLRAFLADGTIPPAVERAIGY